MTEYTAVPNPDRCPTHPGELLREDILPALRRDAGEIASLLGVSCRQLQAILEEQEPVSPDLAARFGKLFGDGAGIWLRMQAAYDAWHAEREVDVSAIPTIRAA